MNSQNKLVLGLIALAIVLAGAFALTRNAEAPEQNTNTEESENNEQSAQTVTVSYQGEEGKTALELLRVNHQVETEEFSGLGEFVTAINGIKAGDSHFWAFYVNGQQAQVGASQYETKNSDQIEWKLEKIQ